MPEAFLGVARSLTGRRWEGPDQTDRRAAERVAQVTGLPPAVCAVLVRQGVTAEGVASHLAPRLRDLMPDPRGLRDMERAAARLSQAVDLSEPVAIFADYDVDGAVSAALLLRWLRSLGIEATVYVPDRITEGYGPNAPAMAELARRHRLIVCVDCGTLAHKAIAMAAGTDVVVLDHHSGGETLPPALAVVNPNRADEDGGLGHLCAAAVVFLTLVEANRQRRTAGQPAPDLLAMLDLVALATVADVVPLRGVNRAFVRQGLRVLNAARRPGLAALAEAARLDGPITSSHLGFVLAPRINAGGRIGTADLGARLLATDNPTAAAALAQRLEALNRERRAVEAAVREAAQAQAEVRDRGGSLVWAAGDAWHPGVVGIVAARLKDTFGRPAVVLGLDGILAKGSARSVAGIDLGAAVQRLAQEGYLVAGGGHPMAAGLTLERAKLDDAMARLGELIACQGFTGPEEPRLRVDAMLAPAGADADLVGTLEGAGPYGAGAPPPRLVLIDTIVREVRRIGGSHLSLSLTGADGCREAVLFDAFSGPLGRALEQTGGGRLHLAGALEINTWGGRPRVRLRLHDAAAT